MLATYLKSLPYSKFVLIEDTVESKADRILDYLIRNHLKNSTSNLVPSTNVHYLTFEGCFDQVKSKFDQPSNSNYSLMTFHDFVSDCLNWFGTAPGLYTELTNLTSANCCCVIVIDSLVHMLYRYGLKETYRVLHELIKEKTNVLQIVAVLHTDMLTEKDSTLKCLHHLATLHMELEPSCHRIAYTYKKSAKKIITQVEEYRFENDRLIMEPLKKLDKQKIEDMIVSETSLPENLSTFKIGLSDKDRQLRDELVLPYLPQAKEKEAGESSSIVGGAAQDGTGGQIHYTLDDTDDWDEEDPDDDLEF